MKFAQSHTHILLALSCLTGCTGQLPGSFRLAQQEQTFSSQQEINTKIDLLWIVDNSASMDISQQKLRNGFASFARRYLQPTWDIRVAVITTDTYMAHPAFSGYLNTEIAGTRGWQSPYIWSRIGSFTNPSWNTSLVNLITGNFDSGVKYGEIVPVWGANWARLLPGLHDGPIPALCSEIMPYFINGVTHCAIRDNAGANTGATNCLTPNTGAGESSVSQCVNTVQNNTIHSNTPIISTMPPTGTPGDANWINSLINNFMINVTTGSAGQGSERGLGSLLQLINDNENTDTAFFRANSLRGIIIVADEDDQTMTIPSSAPSGFKPQSYYACDQASLLALNPTATNRITGNNGFCCTDPAKNCTYGADGTACAAKTVEGHTYTPSVCPREDKLITITDIKTQLDTFFAELGPDAAPNYFVTSIVPLSAAAIQSMQTERNLNDAAVGAIKTVAVDRGDRYIQLSELVGNGSLTMNIAEEDYSPILDAIGRSIVERKSTFTLTRAPTSVEDMIVKVIHANGTETVITADKFVINGKSLVITDTDFILSLAATDRMVINYQPKTVF